MRLAPHLADIGALKSKYGELVRYLSLSLIGAYYQRWRGSIFRNSSRGVQHAEADDWFVLAKGCPQVGLCNVSDISCWIADEVVLIENNDLG